MAMAVTVSVPTFYSVGAESKYVERASAVLCLPFPQILHIDLPYHIMILRNCSVSNMHVINSCSGGVWPLASSVEMC